MFDRTDNRLQYEINLTEGRKMETATNLAEWTQVEEVSTVEFDEAIKVLAEAQQDYDQASLVVDEASTKREIARAKILELMERSGKTKYQLDGYGTVSRATKFSVTIPKDMDSKVAMLKYFRSLGEEMYLAYVSVNSSTLNSYYNENVEKNPEFKIPGVGEPTSINSVRFTKDRKKK